MDSINVLQNVIWVGARGVINEEDVIHVPGVKGIILASMRCLMMEFSSCCKNILAIPLLS